MEETIEKKGIKSLLDPGKGRTIESLFDEIINIRGIHHELGMDESTVRALRKRFNDGGSVSVEKMREVLKVKGYKCVQKEMWG